MESQFTLPAIWHAMGSVAKGVVIILVLMSMYALGITVERLIAFRRSRRQSMGYIGALQPLMSAPGRIREAVGLDPRDLWSHRHVQPGVRFAVDAYVNFARLRPWEEAAISSLTEMFAPKIHADRLAGWPALYPWIDVEGLGYFRSRIPLATRDVEHGLDVARRWCTTRARQERALAILQFKLDILWSMLDAIERGFPDDMPEAERP